MSPPIQKFKLNKKGRDFAVGDIHGCFDALERALTAIAFDPECDRLFCTGDLCDRGPLSKEVLDWLNKPWFYSVKGNHEEILFLFNGNRVDTEFMRKVGASWWLDLCKSNTALKKRILKKYESLPLTIEVDTLEGRVGILHAECPHSDWDKVAPLLTGPFKQKAIAVCLWGGNSIHAVDPVKGLRALIVGHMAQSDVLRVGNTIVLDTGAGYPGKKLTILDLNSLKVMAQVTTV